MQWHLCPLLLVREELCDKKINQADQWLLFSIPNSMNFAITCKPPKRSLQYLARGRASLESSTSNTFTRLISRFSTNSDQHLSRLCGNGIVRCRRRRKTSDYKWCTRESGEVSRRRSGSNQQRKQRPTYNSAIFCMHSPRGKKWKDENDDGMSMYI